ncbi:MAG: flagellar FliJ family protein [Pseudomonadota bacterium]|nr:flagellar FliJ family protein [Pseudomonadota bacterium]
MKGLATLIKLSKRRLDELRRKMALLESQKSQLKQVIAALKEELAMEMQLAEKQPEIAHFYGDFAKRMQKRQAEVESEIVSIDKQMEKLAGEMAEAFSELKKFEIAAENERKRIKKEKARRETILLDEIAGQQHRRRAEEEEGA